MATNPRLLLLDEPAAGLNQTEKVALETLIRDIAKSGTTVVIVEHDMKMVMSLSDHIVVLVNGAKVADGGVGEVRSNPDVIAAYLGVPVAKVAVDA
jgi:ABC-type branched-subunit amino acid transport system ATPase component